MLEEQALMIVMADKNARKVFFKDDFGAFYAFYSRNALTLFHEDWIDALQSGRDMMLLAFRGSAKTTIMRWYVVWCICYAKEPYIIVQSFEDSLSKAWVREVAKILMLPILMSDFGAMFPMSMKKEDMTKSSMGSFESTSGVKIEAKSLGSTIRGANTITQEGESTRPTLLVLDDIDVEKSVQNSDIIEQNERKILGETIGALDPVRRRIIFLGNIINQDGVVPRFRDRFRGSWDIYEQWLYDSTGNCVWPEQFTEDVIANLKRDGERSFAQNYLGIPFTGGDTIIKRTSIKHADSMPSGARMVIGIDPAFSEKTGTDGMGVCMTGHVGVNKYIHTMVGLTGNEKDEERFCTYIEDIYKKYHVAMIVVEENNGGLIIGRMLKKRNLSVTTKKAIKDKVTRLREYEGCFDRGEVFFLPGTENGVEQLLAFPHGAHDDMVDAMVYSFEKSGGVAFGRA